ncbi:hypothetical protein N9K54_04370 [Candidatus Poseidonia alphae]|nr:hypothetical protein [Candidatus Poseidonia alphae]
METKHALLSQRARIAYWSPLVVLLLIGLLNVTPFAGTSSTLEIDGEVSEENMNSVDFYPDEYVETQPFTEDNDDTGIFGGEITRQSTYTNGGDYFVDIGEIGQELSGQIAVMTTLSLFMLVIAFSCRNHQLNANRFMNGKTLTGLGLAVIALFSMLIVITILGDFADVQNDLLGDYEDEDIEDVNEGAWGGLSIPVGDEMESVFIISWSPGVLFWVSLMLVLVAGIGACTNLSYLRFEAGQDERPVWSDEKGPSWFHLDWTKAAFGAVAIAGMVALFAPWYQIDQEWFVSENNDAGIYTNSTHELAWTMSTFSVSLTNDTGLFEEGDGEQSTERSSYSERFELMETSPILMGLRVPLVCMLLLGLAWVAFQATSQTAERIGGSKEQWSLILMSMIMAVVLLSNVSSFEKDMTRNLEDDLPELSPALNFTFQHSNTDDAFSGKSFTQRTEWSWFSETQTIRYATMEWGPSWGYYAVQVIPFLFIAALCMRFGPEVVEIFNLNESFNMPSVDRDVWTAKPVVAVMVASLLVTVIGVGPGQFIQNLSSSAPEELHQWQLDYEYEEYFDEGTKVLADQETHLLTYDTSEFEMPYLENTINVRLQFRCDEGDQGISTDFSDEITWKITAPDGVNTEEMTLSGTRVCSNSWAQEFVQSEVITPDPETYASTEQSYVNLVEIINPLNGVWTLSITATVNEGGDPFSSDSNLNLEYLTDFTSIGNFTAEKTN